MRTAPLRFPALRAGAVRRLVCLLGVLMLVIGFAPATADATTRGLSLSPGSTAWSRIGGTRTSTLTTVAVTVPAAMPVTIGVQSRGSSHSSGYRTTVAIAADGSVSTAFARVRKGAETPLGTSTTLGLTVASGDVLHVEAATVGQSVVRLYVRVWTEGTAKPSAWQATASDSSSSRYRRGGRTYLWASLPASAGVGQRLSFSSSVRSYSAARAAAVGVAAVQAPDGGGSQPAASGTGDSGASPDTGTTATTPDTGTTAASTGDTFGLAVIPDTQAETNDNTNTPFLNRVNWMVAHKDELDLRYVLHTGDMTNWGWLDGGQLTRARAAMDVLKSAGLPYALTIGNHDTAAVGWNGQAGSTGYGGSAYMYNPECPTRLGATACKSWLLVRHTEAFTATFPLSGMGSVGGAFEAGKDDNYWTTFSANNTKWLVLTLELWPRKTAVAWARDVVATHPDHNVIIQTHNYLNGDGTIGTSNGGYGETAPSYLYDEIVSKYANVKLVFCGHTGGFTSRTDTPNGNRVVSYLGNDLGGPGDNPVRILSINTTTGAVTSTVYDPIHNRTVGSTSDTITITR